MDGEAQLAYGGVKGTLEEKYTQRLLEMVDLQKMLSPLKTHSEEILTLLSAVTE